MKATTQQRERYEVVARNAIAQQLNDNRAEFLRGVLFALARMATQEGLLPSDVIPSALPDAIKTA